jgi:hypothetical protein
MEKRVYSDFVAGDIGPLGKVIKDIIVCDDLYIVYLDSTDTIQWATRNYELPEGFGSIQSSVSYWESVTNGLFNSKDSYDIKSLLAEAYCRMLDEKNISLAEAIIDRTTQRIKRQGSEILKESYIVSSLVFTVVIIGTLLGLYVYNYNTSKIPANLYDLVVTSLFGGIGAFIFTYLRLKTYIPQIEISKNVHRVDGALRVFFGLISGGTIALAIKANLILGFLNTVDMTIYIKAFIGIIAGASEVLIPNLIKQIEDKSVHS